MGIEIERRFLVLVDRLPMEAHAPGERMAQGYLSTQPTVRVRWKQRPGAPPEGRLTVKGPGSRVRSEFEYPVPAEDARAMLGLCVGMLEKTRRVVEVAGHRWELDEFHGLLRGLWLAELELRSANEVFELPAWVGAEVTEDPRYTNSSLATRGLPG